MLPEFAKGRRVATMMARYSRKGERKVYDWCLAIIGHHH
jgi:hypothetical protein